MDHVILERLDGWQPIERMVLVATAGRRMYRIAATHLSGPCSVDGTVLTVSMLGRRGVRPGWGTLLTLSSGGLQAATQGVTSAPVEEDSAMCWRADGPLRTLCVPSQAVVFSTTALSEGHSITTLPARSMGRGGNAAPRRVTVAGDANACAAEDERSAMWGRLSGRHLGVLMAWPLGARWESRVVGGSTRARPIVGRAEPAMYETALAADEPVVSISN